MAWESVLKRFEEEGLFIRGGLRGAAALRALLLSWKRRDEYGLGDPEAVDEALRLATDSSFARLASGRIVVAGRPVYASVRGREVVLRWASGLSARWEPPEKFWNMRVTERYRLVFDLIVAELEEDGKTWRVARLKPLRTVADRSALERAVALLEEAGVENPRLMLPPLFVTAGAEAPGAQLTLLLRMGLMCGGEDAPTHVAEVGTLGTLKSTVAMLFEAYGDAWRLTEWPSVATLFGDARTGFTRLSSTRLLIFDEFTKWRRRGGDGYDIWSGVANGIATCTWRRAAGGAKAPGVDKCISTYWLGNPAALKSVAGGVIPPVEHLRVFLSETAQLDGENQRSIISRLATWGSYLSDESARRMVAGLHGLVPRPGLFRAWMEDVYRRAVDVYARAVPPSELEGDARVVERWRSVYAYLVAVGIPEAAAEKLATGAARQTLVIRDEGVEGVEL